MDRLTRRVKLADAFVMARLVPHLINYGFSRLRSWIKGSIYWECPSDSG